MSAADQKLLVLERRIDELTAQVRALQEGICSSVEPLMRIGFTLREAQIVGLLMNKEIVTREAFFTALYGADEGDKPSEKVIEAHIWRVRRKCADFGVKVYMRRFYGWWIDRGAKTRLHTAISNHGEANSRVVAKWRAAPVLSADEIASNPFFTLRAHESTNQAEHAP